MTDRLDTDGHDPLLGCLLADRYLIERAVGKGGMGTVYAARQIGLERDVAVKVLTASFVKSTRESERFRREALATAKLRHPNIVAVYDFGVTADGRAYLVMEYLAGPTLERWIAQHGAADPIEAIEILKPICLAVDASHRAGIIHRDLKPSNIILPDPSDPDDMVRVVDFGIARLREIADGIDLTGPLMLGTPAYMAPEQTESSVADARSDIYSLGVIAYEVLTGQRPFRAPSHRALLMQHLTEPAAPPSSLRPQLPRDVDPVLLKALEKGPDDRFASAREFADALGRALGVASYDEQLQHLRSMTEQDELTGLHNRRSFYARLARSKGRADREGVPFALAIFDVDNFKNVNDTHGHLAGDDVLKTIAGALKSSARGSDVPCRYGGDEFALILEGAARDATERVVAAICDRVRTDDSLHTHYAVSLSAGFTVYTGTGEPLEVIVGTADRALYTVKQRGKDGHEFLAVDAAAALTPSGQPPTTDTPQRTVDTTPVYPGLPVRTGTRTRGLRALEFDGFVGRERELAALNEAVERASAGAVGAALVVGDAGLGKTALVARLAASLENAPLLETRFIEGTAAPPFRQFVDPLGAYLMGRTLGPMETTSTPAESRALSAIARGDTSEFLEALGIGASAGDRFRAFEVLRRAYRRVAREGLVLLVAEDLQWADALSLEFLSYLISSATDAAVFVVATTRTDALLEGAPLRTWARGLARTERFERIELAPLRSHEVRLLVESVCGRLDRRVDISRAIVDRLTRETDGNPLLITEVLRLWASDGTLSFNAESGLWCIGKEAQIAVPPSVAELFEARLSQMDPRVTEILRTAAVIGEEFSLDLLAAVDGRDDDDLVDLVESAMRTGMLAEVRDQKDDVFRFTHAIARRVLCESLTGMRRRRLHARIAAALEARRQMGRTVLASDLARHYLEAREIERAVPHALEAAHAAWRSWALEPAEEALAIVEGAVADGIDIGALQRVRTLLLRGETLAMRGRTSEAVARIEESLGALDGAEADDPPLRIRALRHLGRLLSEAGEPDAAIARLLEALGCAEGNHLDAEAARLRISIGYAFDTLGEFERALDWITSGLAIARDCGDRSSQMHGEIARGRCLGRLGQYAKALEAGYRARALAAVLGDGKHEWEALSLIGGVYHEQADTGRAYDYFVQACDAARAIGDLRGEAHMLNNIGEAHRRAGDFDDAIACYEQIIAIAPEQTARQREGLAVNFALAYVGLGDAVTARRYADDACALNATTSDLFARGYIFYTLAEVALLEGDAEGARTAADRAVEVARSIRSPEIEWLGLFAGARACCDAGDREGAIARLKDCVARLNAMADELASPEDREHFFVDKQPVFDALKALDDAKDQTAG